MKLNPRLVISSYRLFKIAKEKLPHREVIADAHPEQHELYYFSSSGSIRKIDTRDGSVWVCDHEKGFPWMKRVRIVKSFQLKAMEGR